MLNKRQSTTYFASVSEYKAERQATSFSRRVALFMQEELQAVHKKR